MNHKERDFQKEFSRIAPLYKCSLITIPDVLPINKNGKVIKSGEIHISSKLPCDGILCTSHNNYMIEFKYGNNPLLPHQKATESKVLAINSLYYCLRKKVLKKGTFFTVEQPEKVVLFKTQKIEELLDFFRDPSNSQSLMFDSILPHTKRKFKRRVLG